LSLLSCSPAHFAPLVVNSPWLPAALQAAASSSLPSKGAEEEEVEEVEKEKKEVEATARLSVRIARMRTSGGL